jgi:hypothetical protein
MDKPHELDLYMAIGYVNDEQVSVRARTRAQVAHKTARLMLRTMRQTFDVDTTFEVRDFINETLDNGMSMVVELIPQAITEDAKPIYSLTAPDKFTVAGPLDSIAAIMELALQQELHGYIMPTRFHYPLHD